MDSTPTDVVTVLPLVPKLQPQPKTVSTRRRKTFDEAAWRSIQSFRHADDKSVKVEELRHRVVTDDRFEDDLFDDEIPRLRSARRRGRRHTFATNVAGSSHSRSKAYGDLAQQYDMVLKKLREVQVRTMGHFVVARGGAAHHSISTQTNSLLQC